MKSSFGILVCAGCVLLAVASARADTLYLKDGRVLTGKLVSKDAANVIFEVYIGRIRSKMSFPVTSVVNIEAGEIAPAPQPEEAGDDEGAAGKDKTPTYYVIPVTGAIGLEATAAVLEECLKMANYRKPTLVVLQLDSPGGSVRDLQQMIKVLQKYKDLRIAAYVDKAYSAAAILAMSCKEIVISPKGTIGGAAVFRIGPFGTPENIEEKFESILRAEFRSAVKAAGHNHLLLQAMMDTDIVLSLKTLEDGRLEVVEGKPKGTKEIKKRGKILTMTADEAKRCGLAMGLSETVKESNKLFGIEEWTEARNRTPAVFAKWRKELAEAEAEYKKLLEEAKVLTDRAGAHDPGRFTYFVTSGGTLTAASRRNWELHARACIGSLNEAEARIRRLAEIAGKYPGLVEFGRLDFGKEELEAVQRAIARMRQSVAAGAPP